MRMRMLCMFMHMILYILCCEFYYAYAHAYLHGNLAVGVDIRVLFYKLRIGTMNRPRKSINKSNHPDKTYTRKQSSRIQRNVVQKCMCT